MKHMIECDAVNRETKETVKVQVEQNCCITFEDKKFCSGGSFISPDLVIGYTNKTDNGLEITTWHGETLSTRAYKVSRHPWGYTNIRAEINGSWYHGREIKDGDLVRLKPCKRGA